MRLALNFIHLPLLAEYRSELRRDASLSFLTVQEFKISARIGQEGN